MDLETLGTANESQVRVEWVVPVSAMVSMLPARYGAA